MKSIIIVSAFFYPELTPRAFRTTELVKEFCKRDYEVTLYLPRKVNVDYSTFPVIKNLTIKYFTKSKTCDFIPHGHNIISGIIRHILLPIYHLIEFPNIRFMFQIPKYLRKEPHCDLLISIAYPHSIHWGVYMLLRHCQISNNWLADCGDPFMGNQVYSEPFYFKYIEKAFCKHVNYILVPSPSSIEGYYSEFHSKIRVIPQGFDFTKLNVSNYVKNEMPTFAYAGIFYKSYRDPSPFFNYLISLQSDFRFIIYTSRTFLIDRYQSILKDKLIIRDFIPREQLIDNLAKMDFLINFANKGSTQIPSKLIDYSIANRPILSLKYNDEDYHVFDEFLKGNYNNKTLVPNLQQYNIVNVVNQIIDLLE